MRTEKCALIVREILQQAREQLGANFIISLRMSVDEYVEGGLTVDESAEMVNMFVDDGFFSIKDPMSKGLKTSMGLTYVHISTITALKIRLTWGD